MEQPVSARSEQAARDLAKRVLLESGPDILVMARTTDALAFLGHFMAGLTSIMAHECGKAGAEQALGLCADALAANAHDLVPGGLH